MTSKLDIAGLERFGIDAIDLDMIKRGDMLGPKLGAKVFAAIEALTQAAAPDMEAVNIADEIIRAARRGVAAEIKHSSFPPGSTQTARDAADEAWADMTDFSLDQFDAALKIVSRRRHSAAQLSAIQERADALDAECQQSMLDICRERERAEAAEARVAELLARINGGKDA